MIAGKRFGKRLTVRKLVEQQERREKTDATDTALRRSLAASSLQRIGRKTPQVGDQSAPTRKYTHDSEAYKRRPDPTKTVCDLITKGDLVNGVKVS